MNYKKVPFIGEEGQKKLFDELKVENRHAYKRVTKNLKSVDDYGKVKIIFDGF